MSRLQPIIEYAENHGHRLHLEVGSTVSIIVPNELTLKGVVKSVDLSGKYGTTVVIVNGTNKEKLFKLCTKRYIWREALWSIFIKDMPVFTCSRGFSFISL